MANRHPEKIRNSHVTYIVNDKADADADADADAKRPKAETPRVDTDDDAITFLYRVAPGRECRSYGLNVATLAGMPSALVARAGYMVRLVRCRCVAC